MSSKAKKKIHGIGLFGEFRQSLTVIRQEIFNLYPDHDDV